MIKTVWSQTTADFDKLVNDALKEGYRLKLRDVRELTKGMQGLYAELEKPELAPGNEGVAALQIIQQICRRQESCTSCPLNEFIGESVCDVREPETWCLPE